MSTENTTYQLQMARTLWNNTYRGKVTNDSGDYVAAIRVILGIPLDRTEVPENAPDVTAYLTVLVEDATITADELLAFEANLSDVLLIQLRSDYFIPEHCHFFYPSPPALMEEQGLLS